MNHLFTIQQLFSERIFHIPDYQRGFAWEEKQLEEFIEDIELLPEQKDHYTGTIVLHPLERKAKFPDTDEGGKQYTRVDVVDGRCRQLFGKPFSMPSNGTCTPTTSGTSV